MRKIFWNFFPAIIATGSVLPGIAYGQTEDRPGTPGHAAMAAERERMAAGRERKEGSYSPTADLHGEHSMVGKITHIDHGSGQVTVNTEEAGELKLHYPPPSLANLKEGDSVTVHLGFSRSARTPTARIHRGWERDKAMERPGGCPGGFPCP